MGKKNSDPQVQVAYKFPSSLIKKVKDEAHAEGIWPAQVAVRRLLHSYKLSPDSLPTPPDQPR